MQWDAAAKCPDAVSKCFTFRQTSKQEALQAFEEFGTVDDETKKQIQQSANGKVYSVVAENGCLACTKAPFACSLKPTAGTTFDPDQVPGVEWPVGAQGSEWAATFQVGVKEAGGPLNPGAQINQCKYRPGDWGAYINGLHSMYRALLDSADGTSPNGFGSALYAVPEDPYTSEFLESEVNLYVYPNKNNDIYRKQQDAFLDAILAVAVDPTPCVERYKFLDTYPAAKDDTANPPWSYATAEERCEKFLPVADWRAQEQKTIDEAIKAGQHIWELLQKQRPKQGIVALSAHFLPNNSPKTDTWEAALKGQVDPWTFLGAPWGLAPGP